MACHQPPLLLIRKMLLVSFQKVKFIQMISQVLRSNIEESIFNENNTSSIFFALLLLPLDYIELYRQIHLRYSLTDYILVMQDYMLVTSGYMQAM